MQNERDDPRRPRIRLSITAQCVSDTENLEARRYRRSVESISPEDIFDARFESSYLDWKPLTKGSFSVQDEAQTLPELPWISDFHVHATPCESSSTCYYRYFAPYALCLLASRMPNL